MKYFYYRPAALVNKLLDQNTQDLKKSLDEIKQQKDELNKDKRNSTNNKNENDRLNMILSVIDLSITLSINFLSINFCLVNYQMN